MTTTSPGVDAITIEVISQSLAGIVQEMQNSLFCTGYSTIIRESRDASCAIMDLTGQVLAQFTVLPLHLGAFPALGDLQGQVGATWLGVARVQALCEKNGADMVVRAAEQLYLLTEKRVRAAVAEWPDGDYAGEATLHDEGVEGGKPVHVRVLVTIRGDQATFDFRKSDDQVDGPFNIRPPLVQAVCSYALKCLIDPDLPSNQGLTLAVEATTREGSVLCPLIPAPVNTYMPIANVTAEAVFDALSGAVPRARIAGSSGGVGGTLSHTSSTSRYPQVQYELPAGAVGARSDSDGVSASKAHVANGTITPVEIIESEFPVELVRFELIPDSGGPGRFRGGLGYVREYRILGESQLSARGGKLLTPPGGRDGGSPGRLPALIVNPGTSTEHVIRPQDGNVRLHVGDILRREQPGSGGYGDPHTRPAEDVLDDVREGYVSPTSAREVYGVAVQSNGRSWTLETTETERLRTRRP
ncbi:MAG: hydantoinase B/oxoprolinase family protein [Chloroflexi bacterium]|nr:hydantoinase B/oxoprolinase family protein [Chloroflexota bacterium]